MENLNAMPLAVSDDGRWLPEVTWGGQTRAAQDAFSSQGGFAARILLGFC